MNIGEIYIQSHSDVDIYVMPTKLMKNGSYYGLMFHDWHTGRFGGKAKKGSLRDMYPAPSLSLNTPQQVINKLNVGL